MIRFSQIAMWLLLFMLVFEEPRIADGQVLNSYLKSPDNAMLWTRYLINAISSDTNLTEQEKSDIIDIANMLGNNIVNFANNGFVLTPEDVILLILTAQGLGANLNAIAPSMNNWFRTATWQLTGTRDFAFEKSLLDILGSDMSDGRTEGGVRAGFGDASVGGFGSDAVAKAGYNAVEGVDLGAGSSASSGTGQENEVEGPGFETVLSAGSLIWKVLTTISTLSSMSTFLG